MLTANPLRSYQTIATQTAPPGQLVLMLYDGAIRFLERALTGFEKEDPLEFNATIHNNIIRAQDIIRELMSSLDHGRGGDLASTLGGLYGFMDDRLTESNRSKTPAGIHDTIKRLTILREAWSEMMQRQTTSESEPFGEFSMAS